MESRGGSGVVGCRDLWESCAAPEVGCMLGFMDAAPKARHNPVVWNVVVSKGRVNQG